MRGFGKFKPNAKLRKSEAWDVKVSFAGSQHGFSVFKVSCMGTNPASVS